MYLEVLDVISNAVRVSETEIMRTNNLYML